MGGCSMVHGRVCSATTIRGNPVGHDEPAGIKRHKYVEQRCNVQLREGVFMAAVQDRGGVLGNDVVKRGQ
jgi:hypothetical protein